jgi:hypothetical protein
MEIQESRKIYSSGLLSALTIHGCLSPYSQSNRKEKGPPEKTVEIRKSLVVLALTMSFHHRILYPNPIL